MRKNNLINNNLYINESLNNKNLNINESFFY